MTQNLPRDRQASSSSSVCSWQVLAAAEGDCGRVELRRYDLPSPNEMWELDDAPILSVVMPRAGGAEGEIMFDMGDRRRHRVGRLMLRPAGIAMHSRGGGGMLDILTCRFDTTQFAAVTGRVDWDSRVLEHCAAIRSPRLMAAAERLMQEVLSPGFGSAIAVDALLRLLMVDLGRLFRQAMQVEAGQGGLAPWQLARIDEALRSSDGDWPTTQALAQLCGISRSHLSRSFAGTVGTALADHAAAIRMERAQALLRAGDMPISTIAHRLGFATASAFSAAFRRSTGLSPRQFRQSLN